MDQLKEEIEKIFIKIKRPLSLDGIFKATNSTTEERKKQVEEIIQEKSNNHELYQTEDGYILIYKTTKRVGVYHDDGNNKTVIIDNKQYPVLKDKTSHAIDRDTVLVDIPAFGLIGKALTPEEKELKKTKATIIEKVIDRNLDNIIGTIHKENNNYFVIPLKKGQQQLKILVDKNNYKEGEKVFVKLKKHADSIDTNIYSTALVEKINLQEQMDQVLLEAYKFGIYKTFTDETKEQLKSIPEKVREEDKIGKADLTNWEIFTIDGDNTKDIDDAISLYEDKDGNTVLGVHIAYPAYYIKKDGAIYKEALQKGISCYPTSSRVFPMLHPKLSNGICSLNPNVERLALSYIITFDKDANVIDYKIMESVIKSNIQMTYNKVEDLLEKNIVHEGYEEHQETLLKMKDLAQKLEEKRKKRGALTLDAKEIKVSLDDEGKVSKIEERERREADKIIESFMVASAECYANFCKKNDIPCVYRNHDVPLQENINKFIKELKLYGINYTDDVDVNDNNSIQKFSEYIIEHDNTNQVLMGMFIRNLRKADFGVENIGHCGLASPGHVPNTSPMRRGNDFIDQYVLIDMYLNKISSPQIKEEIEKNIPVFNKHKIKNLVVSNNLPQKIDKNLSLKRNKWTKTLTLLTEHLSVQEVKANKCERSVCQMKMVEKMKEQVGKECTGTIIGLSKKNITILLDNYAEVILPIENLQEEDCKYDKKLGYITTKENNYFFGDKVKVRIEDANTENRKIYCHLEEKIEENDACRENIKKYKKQKSGGSK